MGSTTGSNKPRSALLDTTYMDDLYETYDLAVSPVAAPPIQKRSNLVGTMDQELAPDVITTGGTNAGTPGGGDGNGDGTGLFGMKNSTVSGLADLGNLAVSAFATYDAYKTNKLNRQALQANINTAKEEQARRNKNISGFNTAVV